MKIKYLYTICFSLILIFSTIFGVATAADAQEVHALLIMIGDRDMMESAQNNEDQMVRMFMQLSHDCNVKLTLMKSMNSLGNVISKTTTFTKGIGSGSETNPQDTTKSQQVEEWLDTLKSQPEDTVLIYYSGPLSYQPDSRFSSQYLHFDPMDPSDVLEQAVLVERLKQKPARLHMFITDVPRIFRDTESGLGFVGIIAVRTLPRNYVKDLFLDHKGFLHITAALPGKFAIGDPSRGGHFTYALLKHGFTPIADTNRDNFLSWQEVFAKTAEQTKVLYQQATSDPRIAELLSANRQNRQGPMAYSLPKRIVQSR